MTYTIQIQSQGSSEAIAYGDPVENMDRAYTVVAMMVEDFDVIMQDEITLDEARAEMDLDGRFMFAWRMRSEGSDVADIVAIVEEV